MSLQSYFQSLKKEHNVTSLHFVVDRAGGDGRLSVSSSYSSFSAASSTSSDDEGDCLKKQHPSFYTQSERLSLAPICPLRSKDGAKSDRMSQLSQVEAALEVLSMSLSELSQ